MFTALHSVTDIEEEFEQQGFVVIDKILNEEALGALIDLCESEVDAKAGTRNLLRFDWIRKLAGELAQNNTLKKLLPKNALAIQCNYFSKDTKTNWLVPLHRDKSIPVKSRIESEKWSGWSEKEGILYAQPPKQVLEEMVAVRIHLEDNYSHNGALEVVAGSHKSVDKREPRKLAVVQKGGALIMRPLILHKSTKLIHGKRRVLHFVFGPENLPNNAVWANAM